MKRDQRQYMREWYRRKRLDPAWVEKERIRGRNKMRYRRANDPAFAAQERVGKSQRMKNWRAANLERIQQKDRERSVQQNAARNTRRAANPEKIRAIDRQRYQDNPEPMLTRNRARRARLANALCTLTVEQWEAILELADRQCIYCGASVDITMDHLIPLARGGSHTADNVAPACRSCNSSKGIKTVVEFMEEAS